ncbi:MAG: hypothetical protein CSA62_01180 [Planctomycetota bacterium]|nr:MAG: hypothetical protein CSA62_01180 [Planctomycetota bacterium]
MLTSVGSTALPLFREIRDFARRECQMNGVNETRQLGSSDPEGMFPNDPEEAEQVPFSDELFDQLLANYEKPEDLTG